MKNDVTLAFIGFTQAMVSWTTNTEQPQNWMAKSMVFRWWPRIGWATGWPPRQWKVWGTWPLPGQTSLMLWTPQPHLGTGKTLLLNKFSMVAFDSCGETPINWGPSLGCLLRDDSAAITVMTQFSTHNFENWKTLVNWTTRIVAFHALLYFYHFDLGRFLSYLLMQHTQHAGVNGYNPRTRR